MDRQALQVRHVCSFIRQALRIRQGLPFIQALQVRRVFSFISQALQIRQRLPFIQAFASPPCGSIHSGVANPPSFHSRVASSPSVVVNHSVGKSFF